MKKPEEYLDEFAKSYGFRDFGELIPKSNSIYEGIISKMKEYAEDTAKAQREACENQELIKSFLENVFNADYLPFIKQYIQNTPLVTNIDYNNNGYWVICIRTYNYTGEEIPKGRMDYHTSKRPIVSEHWRRATEEEVNSKQSYKGNTYLPPALWTF